MRAPILLPAESKAQGAGGRGGGRARQERVKGSKYVMTEGDFGPCAHNARYR